MAFQDFDHIQERRRLERERKFRRRVAIGAISAFVLVVIVAGGVLAAVTIPKKSKSDDDKSRKEATKVERLIATVCNVTDYKNACNNTLSKAVHKNVTLVEPRQFLKYAMAAASDEVEKVFEKIDKLKFDDPKEKTAWEYCKQLAGHARGELNRSLEGVVLKESFGLRNLTSGAGDLKSWLSSVISYSEMCADAFPEGQKRSDMEKLWTLTKQLTDNSLALVEQFTSYMSALSDNKDKQAGRRLLHETEGHSVDEEGVPVWMTANDRRMLEQAGRANRPQPNITVAKDGSGNYKTISEAIKAVPKKFQGRYVIYVKEGVYDEKVVIPYGMNNLTVYGEGSQKTVITGNRGFKDGLLLHQTASIQIHGHGFMAQSMGFRNTAGPSKHQAIAAQVQSDCAIFVNCRFEGYQDTLWTASHRQFYKKCMIIGTVDFIFGDAAALFQNCVIKVRKPGDGQHNVITASGRTESHESTGIVIQNCRIVADESLKPAKETVKSYLSRPWKDLGRSVIMESEIEDFIAPEGYVPFRGDKGTDTVYFAEYNNKGAGASTAKRVKWSGVKILQNKNNLLYFTAKPFLQGDWITRHGIEVHFGFYTN